MGRLTSAPAQEEATIRATLAIVKIVQTGTSKKYTGETSQIWFNAQVETVENRIGPEPGVATLVVPVAEESSSIGTGKTTSHKVHEATRYPGINVFSAPQFSNTQNFLFSQVFVYNAMSTVDSIEEIDSLGDPFFVGYITDYQWTGNYNSTHMRIKCEDARHFAKKAPTQGVVFNNDIPGGIDELIYIRAHPIVFNEGGDPNMLFNVDDEARSRLAPVFVNKWFNRFVDDPEDPEDRHFIADDEIETSATAVPRIHARHWRPGFAYNYVVNKHVNLLGAASIDKPTMTEFGIAPNVDHYPVDMGDTMKLPLMTPTGMWNQFFEPRANVGGAPQTGTTEFVSALGEMNITGIPMIDNLFEFCRMVGNFTLAGTFQANGKLKLFPIRTTTSFQEDRNVPVGIQGAISGTKGGKGLVIIMPTHKSNFADRRPEVTSWDISLSGQNYFNRYYFHGGKRFIQLTFSTLGISNWRDHLNNDHSDYTPAGEWNPKTEEGSIHPGWTLEDQKKWTDIVDAKRDLELFPDVFRTWIVPDDIDWLKMYNQLVTEPGYRLFFKKDKQALNEMLTAIFEKSLGKYRSRKIRIPFQIWRAYQGIAMDKDGNTKYPGETDGNVVDNNTRWERLQADAQVISGDGRLGFRLNSEARRSKNFTFHDPDATDGPTRRAWSWNFILDSAGNVINPKPFEMIWTTAVEVDEDLFDYTALVRDEVGGMDLQRFGHPMEFHRNAATQYNEEAVANSILDFPIGVTTLATRREVPKFGFTGVKPFRYKRASREVAARAKIQAERHSMSDIEGTLVLESIQTDILAGTYLKALDVPGDRSILIGALIDTVSHDYIANVTTLHLATIR